MGAYHDLDLTIAQALARRSADFAGVVTCTPDDSLASVFHLIRMRRIHRLVVVEGGKPKDGESPEEAAERTQRKGKLLGMISLSDVLKHIIVCHALSSFLDGTCGLTFPFLDREMSTLGVEELELCLSRQCWQQRPKRGKSQLRHDAK